MADTPNSPTPASSPTPPAGSASQGAPSSSGTGASPAAPAKKKRSIGKIILRVCGVLFLLFVVAVIALYFSRNAIVARGVTYAGTYATEQETLLNAADLQLGGTLDLSELKIHNPTAGSTYKEPYFLQMKTCNVIVEPGTLLSNKIVVDSIAISGLEITVEQNGVKNNLSELLNIMKSKSPAASTASGGSSGAPTSPGRSLEIRHINLAASKLHLRGLVSMDLDLPQIQLDDITNPDGRPMKIADVMVNIILHLAQQIVTNPALPADFKNGLKDVNALVNNLKGELDKGLKSATKGLNDAGKQLQNLGNDAGKQLQNLGNDAGKQLQGLQNLIPGQKPPATKP